MKKILFFDTETTGFPNSGPLEGQPNIVQLAGVFGEYELDTFEGSSEKQFDELFKSIVPIPEKLTKIHGISNEMVADKSLLCESPFIKEFMKMMDEADIICGHNVQYDFSMIFIEIERFLKSSEEGDSTDLMERFASFKEKTKKKSFCTMQSSTNVCKLPGRFGSYKWPNLQELHLHLFDKEFEDAHNAMNDIAATKDCFFELMKRGCITIPNP